MVPQRSLDVRLDAMCPLMASYCYRFLLSSGAIDKVQCSDRKTVSTEKWCIQTERKRSRPHVNNLFLLMERRLMATSSNLLAAFYVSTAQLGEAGQAQSGFSTKPLLENATLFTSRYSSHLQQYVKACIATKPLTITPGCTTIIFSKILSYSTGHALLVYAFGQQISSSQIFNTCLDVLSITASSRM
jgi:hypothetical protein